jgi:hypothetical protein
MELDAEGSEKRGGDGQDPVRGTLSLSFGKVELLRAEQGKR